MFFDAYGSQYAWSPRANSNFRNWRSCFGNKHPQRGIRPYWISFKDESMATLVILKMEMENE